LADARNLADSIGTRVAGAIGWHPDPVWLCETSQDILLQLNSKGYRRRAVVFSGVSYIAIDLFCSISSAAG